MLEGGDPLKQQETGDLSHPHCLFFLLSHLLDSRAHIVRVGVWHGRANPVSAVGRAEKTLFSEHSRVWLALVFDSDVTK